MRIVGLTGSIGMGKSTTAAMFADLGVPVHDSDAAVHALYQETDTVTAVDQAFPGVAVDGKIDRKKLSTHVIGKPDAMARLEAIVHPRVHAKEQAFLDKARAAAAPYVILDIPLLYETGAEARCDQVLVVTAGPETQRQRVLARPEMSEEKFEAILAKQMPDAEKRVRADFVVETDDGMDSARAQVHAIHELLLQRSRGGAKS